MISLKFKGNFSPDILAEVDTIGLPRELIISRQKSLFGTLNAIEFKSPIIYFETLLGLSNTKVVGSSLDSFSSLSTSLIETYS